MIGAGRQRTQEQPWSESESPQLLAGKPYRIVWHIPRKVFAIERRGALVGICWAWSLDDRWRPGDVVLMSQETFDALATAMPELELPAAA